MFFGIYSANVNCGTSHFWCLHFSAMLWASLPCLLLSAFQQFSTADFCVHLLKMVCLLFITTTKLRTNVQNLKTDHITDIIIPVQRTEKCNWINISFDTVSKSLICVPLPPCISASYLLVLQSSLFVFVFVYLFSCMCGHVCFNAVFVCV